MQSVFEISVKILSVTEQVHHLTREIPTDLDEVLYQFIRQMFSPCDRIGWYRDMEFLSACPILLYKKEMVVLIQLLRKPS